MGCFAQSFLCDHDVRLPPGRHSESPRDALSCILVILSAGKYQMNNFRSRYWLPKNWGEPLGNAELSKRWTFKHLVSLSVRVSLSFHFRFRRFQP